LNRSTIFASIFIIAFLVGSGFSYEIVNPQQYEKRITDLQNEITDLNSQISTLMAENAALESQISQLESQLNTKVLGVYFSPKGGCEAQVLRWISRANESIHVLIYSFTLDSIDDALVEAYNRGVEIKVVFEKEQISTYSEYQKLKVAGVLVRNDTNSDLMHDKIMIVDGVIVLTGSFNWSNSAENSNNENLIVINSTSVAAQYEAEFLKIWNKGV
jgi:phosphatidylserine/phosphatidylglycerophosphate/cardiolipin synthase-like enzyme